MYMLKFVGDICFTDNHFDVGFGVGSAIKNGKNPFFHTFFLQKRIF